MDSSELPYWQQYIEVLFLDAKITFSFKIANVIVKNVQGELDW